MSESMHIIDCDGHVAEPFSLYTDYCEPEFRDRMPRRIDDDGRRRVVVDGKEFPNFVKYGGRPLGRENDAMIPRPVQHGTVSEGGVNPAIRLRDMDKEGIDVAVLYTSGTTSMCAIENGELESAAYQAYNRWLEEYCSADTRRLKGMVMGSIRHPDLGVKEFERVADQDWVGGILLQTHIDDYNLDHPRFDPIWQVATHYDLPVCFHAGAGRPPYAVGTNECSENLFLMHAMAHPFEQMRCMAAMMGGGVYDRFPTLRTGFIECGVGWLPWWLGWLEVHQENLPDHVPFMRRKPREYLEAEQVFVNCFPDEPTFEAVVGLLGDGNVIYGSDYPHWDCGFPGTVERILRRNIPMESIRRIFCDNALRLHTRIEPPAQRGQQAA